MADVNTRPHRATRQPPVVLLAQEHEHHAPAATVAAHAVLRADPQGRPPSDRVASGDAIYSVPHELIGERVWARVGGQRAGDRARRLARRAARGRPPRADHAGPAEHPRRALPAQAGRARWSASPGLAAAEEREFLAIGEGARAVAEARRRGGNARGSGARWPRRSTSPSSTAPGRSKTRSSGAPATAGSPTATWPASSPTSRQRP